jgi:hypothetical protein
MQAPASAQIATDTDGRAHYPGDPTMRLFWKLWINTARSMLSVAGAR